MQKITLSALIVLFSYLLSAQDVYWVSYKSEPNFSPASVKLTRSEGMSEAAYQQVIGGKFHPIIEEKFVIKTEDSTIYFDGDSYSDGQKYSSTKLKASKLCTIYDYKSDSVVKFLFTADFAFKSKIDIKHWVIEDTAENPIGGISVKVAHNESDANERVWFTQKANIEGLGPGEFSTLPGLVIKYRSNGLVLLFSELKKVANFNPPDTTKIKNILYSQKEFAKLNRAFLQN